MSWIGQFSETFLGTSVVVAGENGQIVRKFRANPKLAVTLEIGRKSAGEHDGTGLRS